MRPRVALAEARSGQVGIELGGADASMAKERLDHAQVCSAFEQMSREAVPEGVRRDAPGHPGRLSPVPHQAPDRFSRQPLPTLADEDCGAGTPGRPGRAGPGQVPMQSLPGLIAHWHAALAVSLADDTPLDP